MDVVKSVSAKKTLATMTLLLILFAFITPIYTFADLVPCDGADCDFDSLIELIKNIVTFLLFSFAVPLAAISFAIAGVMILTAGGNTGQVEKAKEIFWNVLIGLIVALSAWLIVNAILLGLGASGLASLQYPLYL